MSQVVLPVAIGMVMVVGPLVTSLAGGDGLPISAAYLALHVTPALLLATTTFWHCRAWSRFAFAGLALVVGAGPLVAPLLGVGPEIVVSVHAAAYHYGPAAILLGAARRASRQIPTASHRLSTDPTRAQ